MRSIFTCVVFFDSPPIRAHSARAGVAKLTGVKRHKAFELAGLPK